MKHNFYPSEGQIAVMADLVASGIDENLSAEISTHEVELEQCSEEVLNKIVNEKRCYDFIRQEAADILMRRKNS